MSWPSPSSKLPEPDHDEASQRALVSSILSDALRDCTMEEFYKKLNILCSKGVSMDVNKIAVDNMLGESRATLATDLELQSDDEDEDDDATSWVARRAQPRHHHRSDEDGTLRTIFLDLDANDNDDDGSVPENIEELGLIIEGMILLELDAFEKQQELPFDYGADDYNELLSTSKDSIELAKCRKQVHHSSDMATASKNASESF
jgi:antitoxin component of RelBE/YafQ-DinJ toxin-antitoxin module